jgi:SAM-dependent methyltransferase
MADFKEQFYKGYYRTHIVPRKGEFTLERFHVYGRVFDRQWSDLLPADTGARILDVGCGSGSLVWWLQQRGYTQASGVDVSPEQVRIAGSLGVKNVFQADLGEYLNGRPESYDLLIFRDVLEHFTRETVLLTLEACRSALRPGGALAIQVPNAETPLWGRIRHGDFTHELSFTEGSLRQLFATAGYDDLRFLPSGPVLQGPRDIPRHLLWKGVEALYKLLAYAETGRRRVIVTQNIIAVGRPKPSTTGRE